MKILFRAFLLFIAFLIALGIVKWLFVKLFVLALWVAMIAFVAYIIFAVLKRA